MTTGSRKSHSGQSLASLARSLALTFCILAVGSWAPVVVEAHSDYNPMHQFEYHLSVLYYTLSSRITALEKTINVLSKQECQTGTVNTALCPGFKEAPFPDINSCVVSPIAGAGASISDVTVTFDQPFSKPPIVDATFSGLAILSAKNCSLEVIDVQSTQFTVRQVADDFLPVATQFSYFACPAALH